MSRVHRAARLIGRDSELAVLRRLVAEAAEGTGSVVVVEGEPGVGKSRLLAEAVAAARADGATVLVGRAVEGGGAYRALADALLTHQRTADLPAPAALGPFAGALGRLVPGWVDATGEQPVADLPLLVSEGLLRALRLLAGNGAAVLAVDDVHWADADTLTVLDRLAEAVASAPVMVLLLARPTDSPALDRLRTSPRAHPVKLRPLAPSDASALADACAAQTPLPDHVRRHIVDHSEGLPFLVEELLTGLVDAGLLVHTAAGWEAPADVRGRVPASFAGLVQSRLDALDPTVRTVVDAAAVVGRTVDWHLLTTMTGLTESALLDALRVAVDRGLLAYDGGDADTFRFVHALTREAVVERLLPPQRTALARRAAEAVETDGTDLVLAADLHAQAGDPHRAAALLLRAAAAEAALGTSAELLRRARSLDPADSDAALGLVEVLALSGQAAEARELGDELLARLPAGDARRGRLALTLARACLVAAQAEDGEGYLAQAEPGEAAAALGAHLAFQLHRPDDAERLALAATEATDPAVRCEAFEMIGRVARLRGQPHAAEAAFSRALTVAEEHALPLWRVRALHELGTLDLLGPARADRLELARDLAVQTGGLWTAAVLDLQLMACHALVMDHAATLETARRGIELAESLRLPVLAGAGLVFVAIAQAHLGETEAMHATLDEAAGRLRVDDVDQYAAVLFVRGTPALLEHDLPALRTSLQQGMEVLRRNPSASPSPYRGLHALVETVLGDGEAEREELRASGATVQAANAGTLAYADAVAGGRAGRDPAPYVAAADRVLAPLVWRRHHARLLVAPAALRDGWGSPVEWLREALAHFESTGDLGLVRACREQLRVAGAPVPRKGRGDSAVPPHLRRLGVTSREMDVLSLVAGGLPTSAIAERLFLSPRTVETHVANLLSKTGAAGRAELANYVAGDR